MDLLVGIPATLDSYVSTGLISQSSCRRDQVEKAALANRRVGAWTIDFADQRDRLRCRFINENGDMGTTHEASILQSFLNHVLRFVGGQIRDMHVVNQRKVDISRTTDACFNR